MLYVYHVVANIGHGNLPSECRVHLSVNSAYRCSICSKTPHTLEEPATLLVLGRICYFNGEVIEPRRPLSPLRLD